MADVIGSPKKAATAPCPEPTANHNSSCCATAFGTSEALIGESLKNDTFRLGRGRPREEALLLGKRSVATFKVEDNAVVHTPTGARFTAYPGVSAPHIVTKGMLGSVLKNGDDYREDDVTAMALKLLAERLE